MAENDIKYMREKADGTFEEVNGSLGSTTQLDVTLANIGANTVAVTGPAFAETTDGKNVKLPAGYTAPADNDQWRQILTSDANGDFVANFEIADVSDIIPAEGVLGRKNGFLSIGDGVTQGGTYVSSPFSSGIGGKPAGMVSMVSAKTTNINVNVKHDGTDGATGICYSKNYGTPVYSAVAAETTKYISIVGSTGGPCIIHIWPATSATSGVVGNLTLLYCHSNQLTALDVSGNPSLDDLYCHSNQLTSLDVSGNPSLSRLSCSSNQLTALDVSGNPSLDDLSCSSNQLTALDVSGNPSLSRLSCSSNQLTALDVSGNPSLNNLTCENNNLTALDVSGNPSLNNLTCENNNLTALDVSGNPSLSRLTCENNNLSNLNISGLTLLEDLTCQDNQLTSITGVGFRGGSYVHSVFTNRYPNFENNLLETDAIYNLLNEMAVADPAPAAFLLNGNPCEVADVLQDGVIYTAAETEALAATKLVTLIYN